CVLSLFFFSSRRRHTRFSRDWSSDVCSSDLLLKTLFRPENTLCTYGKLFSIRKTSQKANNDNNNNDDCINVSASHKSITSGENRSEERRVGKECRSRRSR